MSIVQPRTNDEVTMAAARLARGSPNLWADFMRHLAQAVGESVAACVQSPPDRLFVMQGRAQALAELQQRLVNSPAEADKLEAKLKERPNGRQ